VRSSPDLPERFLDELANRLWAARGKSLVVSGGNEIREQVLVNFVNHLLGNYGKTVDLDRPSLQAQGNDHELENLLRELRDGKVQALFVYGANPAYDLPGGTEVLRKVPLVVSLAERGDETASLAHYICPDRHYLESWADTEPVAGSISVTQPVIPQLASTRPILESLAVWSGCPKPVYDILRESWRTRIYPRRMRQTSFDEFWDSAVHDGYVEVGPETFRAQPFKTAVVEAIEAPKPSTEFELVLYPTVAMQDGRHAYNPWLHELPDPINKVTWDNCASLSPVIAQKLGVQEGDMVKIEVPGVPSVELPAYIQPGQHEKVIAVALGYGSKLSSRFANIGPSWIDGKPSVGENGMVGVNAAPLLSLAAGDLKYSRPAKLTPTGRRQPLAPEVHALDREVEREGEVAGQVLFGEAGSDFRQLRALGRRGGHQARQRIAGRDLRYQQIAEIPRQFAAEMLQVVAVALQFLDNLQHALRVAFRQRRGDALQRFQRERSQQRPHFRRFQLRAAAGNSLVQRRKRIAHAPFPRLRQHRQRFSVGLNAFLLADPGHARHQVLEIH
jgi:hypothetical protein